MKTFTASLLLLVSFTLSCNKSASSENQKSSALQKQHVQLTKPERKGESMGQIDSSPRVLWYRNYKLVSSKTNSVFYISIFKTIRREEDGILDPNRPGGPDNRKIISINETKISLKDSTGKIILEKDYSEEFKELIGFIDETSQKIPVPKDLMNQQDSDKEFDKEVIKIAKSKFAFNAEKVQATPDLVY